MFLLGELLLLLVRLLQAVADIIGWLISSVLWPALEGLVAVVAKVVLGLSQGLGIPLSLPVWSILLMLLALGSTALLIVSVTMGLAVALFAYIATSSGGTLLLILAFGLLVGLVLFVINRGGSDVLQPSEDGAIVGYSDWDMNA